MASGMTDEELQDVYTWVDQISLSRPKKNISRDFSDGVLVAEIVKSFYPKLVELHNYSAANGIAQKVYNWETLNKKLFKKLGLFVNENEVNHVVSCKPYVIERILLRLRAALAQYRLKKQQRKSSTFPHNREVKEEDRYGSLQATAAHSHGHAIPSSRQQFEASYTGVEQPDLTHTSTTIPGMNAYHFPLPEGGKNPATLDPMMHRSDLTKLPQQELNAVLVEKDQTIRELRETVHILEQKTKKLEQLVSLKDSKIQTLLEGLHG